MSHGPFPDHLNSPPLAHSSLSLNNVVVVPSKEQAFYGGALASGFPFSLIDTHR